MKKMICVLFALLLTASMGGCQVMDEALVGAGLKEQMNDTSGFDQMQERRKEQEKKDAEAALKAQDDAAFFTMMDEVFADTAFVNQYEMENVTEEVTQSGGCAGCGDNRTGAYQTPDARPSGKSSIAASRIPKDINALMQQCSAYANLPISSYAAEDFKYALLVQDEDFSSVNPDCWRELYQFPYNLYGKDATGTKPVSVPTNIADADYAFRTNAACMRLYGEEVIDRCIDVARKYVRANLSCDYSDPAKNQALAQEWGDATYAYDVAKKLALSKTTDTKEKELIADADFATDRSLVYQDAEGHMRVRGTVVVKNNHIVNDPKIKSGDWYFYNTEVIVKVNRGVQYYSCGEIMLSTAYCPASEADKAVLAAVLTAMP